MNSCKLKGHFLITPFINLSCLEICFWDKNDFAVHDFANLPWDAQRMGWSRHCLVACSHSHATRRRRFAPEVWVRCGEPTLPFGTKGAPNARAARQRLSKINGRDAAPSGSHICGEAALASRRDAASRLRFGTPRGWRALMSNRRIFEPRIFRRINTNKTENKHLRRSRSLFVKIRSI